MNEIPTLIRVFAYLSILTVGGGMAAFPEMEHLSVTVHHWMTSAQLVHMYSVGQMAPGPNMMMIVSIGDWAGADRRQASIRYQRLTFAISEAILSFRASFH